MVTARRAMVIGWYVGVAAAAFAMAEALSDGQTPPVPLVAIVCLLVVAVGISGSVSGRLSVIGVAGLGLVAPLLALGWTGDGIRVLVMALPFLAPGLLVGDQTVRWGRRFDPSVLVAIGGSLLATVVRVMALDPFRVIECSPICPANPYVVAHRPLLDSVVRLSVLALVIGWAALSARGATRREAITSTTVVILSAVVLLTPSWLAVLDDPDGWRRLLVALVALTLMILAADGVENDLRQIMLRRRIRAATAAVGGDGGEVDTESLLRKAFGDPALRVAYPMHGGQRLGADGHPFEGSIDGPHTPIELVRRGVVVAELLTTADRRVISSLTPQLVIAIENESLLVQTRSLLDELRRSRQRLVASADETRHRLERDLHDGAQQRLLSIVMLLQADRGAADRYGALHEAQIALAELRRIARGLFPVSLDQLGLHAALESYRNEAPIVLELDIAGLDRRLPLEIECVAYRVVRSCVEQSARHGAAVAAVHVGLDTDDLRIVVEHDGEPLVDLIDIEDRLGAYGGFVTVQHSNGQERAEAVLPCG